MISRLTQLTRPASILGLPAISLPVGWTSDGPLSVQAIGPPGSEARLAALCETLETRLAPSDVPVHEAV